MVAKAKKITRKPLSIAQAKKDKPLKKIRIGILVGKDFDPVKKGTEPVNFPKKFIFTNDDWGKYSIDACTPLRMQEMHPDLLDIDIIPRKEVKQQRLKQNHVNMSFWWEYTTAQMTGDKKHADEVMKCFKNPDCRLDPSWDYYEWIVNKPRYMQQCIKAGIPMIPTVFYTNGFDPKQCMKDVQKKGWDKFFCKVGQFACFGNGAINGKTEDFLGKRFKELEKYAKDNKSSKVFLLQPYMLKPNGEVYDEVRNFFVDGEWRYSIFTHGTDESDAGYYEEPDGPRKQACKALALKVYEQVLKTASWQGKPITPLLNRIDIGVIPKKGGDSFNKTDNTYFCNEIELIMTTWLDRYAPIPMQAVMSNAAVKHSIKLLVGLLKAKRKIPDEAEVKKTLKALSDRVGPFKNLSIPA